PDWQWSIWRTEGYQNGRNYIGYSNMQVDQMFESARREFDRETRQELYRQIHKMTYDDQPYTWIYQSPNLTLFHRRIQGVQFSPRGIFSFYPSHLKWWAVKK
ncbi:MAG: peptide ABC transporter substrate-binding protein, partial [Planctomycetes bacterium]|nr:peptide ABC transporter substrate-binding protein [Planctomycetota bacterium]